MFEQDEGITMLEQYEGEPMSEQDEGVPMSEQYEGVPMSEQDEGMPMSEQDGGASKRKHRKIETHQANDGSVDSLPAEMLCCVFDFLAKPTQALCRHVCRWWARLIPPIPVRDPCSSFASIGDARCMVLYWPAVASDAGHGLRVLRAASVGGHADCLLALRDRGLWEERVSGDGFDAGDDFDAGRDIGDDEYGRALSAARRMRDIVRWVAGSGSIACLDALWREAPIFRLLRSRAASSGTSCALCRSEDRRDALDLLTGSLEPWDVTACAAAASAGSLECLRFLHERGCPWDAAIPAAAASVDALGCMDYARSHGCRFEASAACVAAEAGHVDCLLYALREGGVILHARSAKDLCASAARGGDVAALVVAWELGGRAAGRTTSREAGAGGHVECLRFLFDIGCPLDAGVMREAARGGHVACVRWLSEAGCRWDASVCAAAAGAGRLDVLTWLRERGCPWDVETPLAAAGAGSAGCLRYAVGGGCPWDVFAATKAAESGCLDCLAYLYDLALGDEGSFFAARKSCAALDEIVLFESARRGHADCVDWLIRRGCRPRPEMRAVAAMSGSLAALIRIDEALGGGWPDEVDRVCDPCGDAAEGGHVDCLRYLHERGCPWDEYTCHRAARNGHLDCLRYAHESGCPWDENCCCEASAGDHLECLRYARAGGCPWDVFATTFAAISGSLSCLRYACENGCPYDISRIQFHIDRTQSRPGLRECLHYLLWMDGRDSSIA